MANEKMDIESLVNVEIPPLSDTAMRVSTLVQDMNASPRAIAEAIGYDPALSARILRAANSPLYAVERNIMTLPAAVITLGNQTLYALAIISTASDTFDAQVRQKPACRKLLEHLVSCGLIARELSRILGMRGTDEAFLCGLLHDIGKLVMFKRDEKLYSEVEVPDEEESLRLEQLRFGFTHAQIGALIAKRWGLPEAICHAIYSHHQPSEASQHIFMARLVDVANQLAHDGEDGILQEEENHLTLTESGMALRLTASHLQAAWSGAESKMSGMLSLL